jgi:hypothetical protein
MILPDGWYKLTSGNNTFIRYFEGDYTETGYHVSEFTRLGHTLTPVVVLSVEEHDKLQRDAAIAETMLQFSKDKAVR